MLSRVALTQKHDTNCRHEHENPDDLKRKIVIAEKCRADIPHIVGCRTPERRKSLLGSLKVSNHKANLNE